MKIDLATMLIYEKNIYFKRKIINFLHQVNPHIKEM